MRVVKATATIPPNLLRAVLPSIITITLVHLGMLRRGLLCHLLRTRAASQAVGDQAQLALTIVARPYLSSAASISSASRSGLSPSYSTLVSGCRRVVAILKSQS